MIALPSLRVKGPYLAMVTLAFGIVVEKLVTEWTDLFGGAQGLFGIRPLTWNGQPLSMNQWVWFGIGLSVLAHLLIRNIVSSRQGRAWLSIQADEMTWVGVASRVASSRACRMDCSCCSWGEAGGAFWACAGLAKSRAAVRPAMHRRIGRR